MHRKIILLLVGASLIICSCGSFDSTPTITSTPVKEKIQTKILDRIIITQTIAVVPLPQDQNGTGVKKTPPWYNMSTPDFLPQPGDENLHRQSVFIEKTEIIPLQNHDRKVAIDVSGSLPTPCNQLRMEINVLDENNKVVLTVYSLIETDMICAQVLSPFTEKVYVDLPQSGTYSVWLNDEQIGEVTIP